MTNGEKYLKEGITPHDLTNFLKLKQPTNYIDMTFNDIELWLNEKAKPILTEDERIILRNIDIDNYKGIGRKNDTLYLVSTIPNYFGGENDKEVFWYCFHELFQFIKERRRILNRGTFERRIIMCNFFGSFALEYGTLYLTDYINGNVQFFRVNSLIPTSWYH